jgi:hypothetical protein
MHVGPILMSAQPREMAALGRRECVFGGVITCLSGRPRKANPENLKTVLRNHGCESG